MPRVSLTVNDRDVELEIEPSTLLVELLRERLDLTGTHVGCDTSQCGACVVHVDGVSVKSCSMLAVEAAGRSVTTIEGLPGTATHPVQRAWTELSVPQCGYCQSGMIMAATAMLAENPAPSDADIERHMSNLCRCGSYQMVRTAIRQAADTLRDSGTEVL